MTSLPTANRGRARQVGWLAVMTVLLIGLVWFQFFRQAETPAGTSNSSAPVAPESAARPGPAPTLQSVRLGTLDAIPELAESNRNPFAFGVRIAPPLSASRPAAAPFAPVMPPLMPALPAGPPPIGLKLIGIVNLPGTARPMVTLKDPVGNGVFHAFEGDIVDGRYRVVKIGVQSVVLSYVDGTSPRTIGLGG